MMLSLFENGVWILNRMASNRINIQYWHWLLSMAWMTRMANMASATLWDLFKTNNFRWQIVKCDDERWRSKGVDVRTAATLRNLDTWLWRNDPFGECPIGTRSIIHGFIGAEPVIIIGPGVHFVNPTRFRQSYGIFNAISFFCSGPGRRRNAKGKLC